MENKELNFKTRESFGTSASRRLRSDGEIPVSILFHDASNLSATVSEREFVHVAESSHWTDVFKVTSEDSKLNDLKLLVKEVQKEPMKGRVLHVDFQALDDNVAVKVRVPVEVEGASRGVKNEGGILTQSARYIYISCLPARIPASLSVDVTPLRVGDSILAEEVKLPEGAELKSNARETIVSVVSSRATRLQEAAAAGSEGSDEAAAEGSEEASAEETQSE